jgi:hypothetical protein
MIRPGGLLHFVVPHWGGIVGRQRQQKWKWFTHPEHIHYYSIDTLPAAVERCGFTVESVGTPYREGEAVECFDAFGVPQESRTAAAENAIARILSMGLEVLKLIAKRC